MSNSVDKRAELSGQTVADLFEHFDSQSDKLRELGYFLACSRPTFSENFLEFALAQLKFVFTKTILIGKIKESLNYLEHFTLTETELNRNLKSRPAPGSSR